MNRNLNRRIHPIAEADGLSPKEHLIKNLVKIDGVEFITKQDALKAVTMEHNDVVDSFNRFLGDFTLAQVGIEINTADGNELSIKIKSKK